METNENIGLSWFIYFIILFNNLGFELLLINDYIKFDFLNKSNKFLNKIIKNLI
jgi:hypothetical protein